MRVVKAMALLVLLITTLTTSTEVWDIRLVQALEERLFYRVSLFTIMGDCTRCKMDTGSWNEDLLPRLRLFHLPLVGQQHDRYGWQLPENVGRRSSEAELVVAGRLCSPVIGGCQQAESRDLAELS